MKTAFQHFPASSTRHHTLAIRACLFAGLVLFGTIVNDLSASPAQLQHGATSRQHAMAASAAARS